MAQAHFRPGAGHRARLHVQSFALVREALCEHGLLHAPPRAARHRRDHKGELHGAQQRLLRVGVVNAQHLLVAREQVGCSRRHHAAAEPLQLGARHGRAANGGLPLPPRQKRRVGKLAAEVVADRAAGRETKGLKAVQDHVVEAAAEMAPKEPIGVRGDYAIAFGGGQDGLKPGTPG